jgi:hypothetical protein
MIPCSLVDGDQRFGRMYYVTSIRKRRQYVSLKRWYPAEFHNPDDYNMNIHRPENLPFHVDGTPQILYLNTSVMEMSFSLTLLYIHIIILLREIVVGVPE